MLRVTVRIPRRTLALLLMLLALLAVLVLLTPAPDAPSQPGDVRIARVMPVNHWAEANADDLCCGWVELINAGSEPASLSGWGLADRPYKIRTLLPDVTLAPDESVRIWLLSAAQQPACPAVLYADFTLSPGESLTLFSPDGVLAESFSVPQAAEGQILLPNGGGLE